MTNVCRSSSLKQWRAHPTEIVSIIYTDCVWPNSVGLERVYDCCIFCACGAARLQRDVQNVDESKRNSLVSLLQAEGKQTRPIQNEVICRRRKSGHGYFLLDVRDTWDITPVTSGGHRTERNMKPFANIYMQDPERLEIELCRGVWCLNEEHRGTGGFSIFASHCCQFSKKEDVGGIPQDLSIRRPSTWCFKALKY